MATTLEQHVALHEALIPSAQRLRIGQSNFRLPSDIQSKEPTLQVIKTLTNVNVNKLYQPWRSFAAVINKFPTGKSSGTDSLSSKTQGECQKEKKVVLLHPPLLLLPLLLQHQQLLVAAPRLSAAAKGMESIFTTGSTTGREESEGDKTDENADDDDEEETTKIGEQEITESDEDDDEATESDRESEDEETREQEEESFDPIPRMPKDNEDDDNNEEDQGLRIGEEERMQEEEDAEELYRGLESLFTTGSTIGTPIPLPQSTMTPSIISTFTSASQLPTSLTQILSLDLQSLLTFASVFRFEDRVKSLEDNFSNIPSIVTQYINLQMPEAVREAMQTQTTQLQDSIQRENDEFLKTIDENMKKIIKEQVKSQVKAQVTRILPRIKEAVNAQLEAEVLTRSSHSSRTSYVVAADLSEMELKKILIEKMEGNKSIQRSDEQRNLYKALVEAYDADKTILDTYGESTKAKTRG
nr:hypothetical protein [Tanacetum cinerariifolium]